MGDGFVEFFEALLTGVGPEVLEHMWPSFVGGFEAFLREQGAWFHGAQERAQGLALHLVDAAHDVVQIEFTGIFESRGFCQFLQGRQGVVMEVLHPLGFGLYHQGHLAFGILGGHSSWAVARVASLSLDATYSEHEATGTVAPIGSHGQGASNVKGAHDFATRPDFDFVS